MSGDIIERAEAFLVDRESDMIHADRIVRDLLAALKAALAERERMTPEWGTGDAGNKPIQTGDTEEQALTWAIRHPHSPAWRRYVTSWERMT